MNVQVGVTAGEHFGVQVHAPPVHWQSSAMHTPPVHGDGEPHGMAHPVGAAPAGRPPVVVASQPGCAHVWAQQPGSVDRQPVAHSALV